MTKTSTPHRLSETNANDTNFVKPDTILGIPFTLVHAVLQPSQFQNRQTGQMNEQAICTIVFHASDDDGEYQFSNGGGRFLQQIRNLVESEQFPVIATVERNTAGKAGPNGIYPLMLMDPRSDRGEPDMSWHGKPDRT